MVCRKIISENIYILHGMIKRENREWNLKLIHWLLSTKPLITTSTLEQEWKLSKYYIIVFAIYFQKSFKSAITRTMSNHSKENFKSSCSKWTSVICRSSSSTATRTRMKSIKIQYHRLRNLVSKRTSNPPPLRHEMNFKLIIKMNFKNQQKFLRLQATTKV